MAVSSSGPGGIRPGSYPPQSLSQDQRQWLYEYFGHSGQAPVGYGGENKGVGAVTFDFNLEDEQKKAYESLKPFYEKLLSFSQGDLDLAKRIIQYTYDQGMRETTQEKQAAIDEQARLFPQEQSQLQTSLNRRGILQSGIANKNFGNLASSQDARALAVQRAYENKTSRLEEEKATSLTGKENEFAKEQFQQEREQRQESRDIAQEKFGVASTKYSVALAQAQREENAKMQQEEQDAYKRYLEDQGYTFA